MIELTNANYHSPEANAAFWSNSLFSNFCECPAKAVATLKGEFKEKRTAALAFGSLLDRALTAPDDLDAYMTGPESFDDEGKSFFFDAKGKLRDNADMRAFHATLARVKGDPLMAGMESWEKQRIFTGQIAGLPWKVMLDFWVGAKGAETIIDLKFVKALGMDWCMGVGLAGEQPRNVKVPWYDAYGYFRSMATYREIVRQNIGTVPLVALFAFTKQDPPDAASVSFDSEAALQRFDREVERVADKLPEFEKMRRGEIPAPQCDGNDCAYCRGRHTLENQVTAEVLRMVTA